MSALDELRDNLELLDQRMSSYESLIDQGFITSNHLIDLEIRNNQLTFDIQEKKHLQPLLHYLKQQLQKIVQILGYFAKGTVYIRIASSVN